MPPRKAYIVQKQTIKSLLDSFPEDVDLDAFLEQVILLEKLEIGERQIAAGNVVNHEQAKKRLARWLN
ncbi:MAG: hypothetical protein CMJ58_02890 [Planctomycetaceae bacterium]|nr:hypothetical protein [Planctomycetaceae bacterium]